MIPRWSEEQKHEIQLFLGYGSDITPELDAAIRACLASAEQAERLERELNEYKAGAAAAVDRISAETIALRQRAEAAEAKAAALWDRLNDLQQYPGTRTEEP